MFRKLLIAAAAFAAGLTALPATASAADHDRYRGGYYSDRGYDRGAYHRRSYDRRGSSSRRYRTRGYRTLYRVYPVYPVYPVYRTRYRPAYVYGSRGYRGGHRYRNCGSGTTGAVIGGAAGALIGRDIAQGGGRYYRRGRGSGTSGAIIGGAVGALVGREIARNC